MAAIIYITAKKDSGGTINQIQLEPSSQSES